VAPIKEAKVELQEHKVLENNLKLEFLVSSILRCPQDYSERQGDWIVVDSIAFGHQPHQTQGSRVLRHIVSLELTNHRRTAQTSIAMKDLIAMTISIVSSFRSVIIQANLR
jgi:hypothetical protein